MSLAAAQLILIPGTAFRRAATRRLTAQVGTERADRIWAETRRRHPAIARARPHHSFGVDTLLRTFEWDCALYLSARDDGLSEAAVGRLIEAINWDLFGPAIRSGFTVSRLRSRRLSTRLRWLLDRMFGLLFTAPFERRKHATEPDIAFDVTACPLADYFSDQGVPELTRYAACSLDHHMAATWGVRLSRRETLAEGGTACDFRFVMPRRAGGSAEAATHPDPDTPRSSRESR